MAIDKLAPALNPALKQLEKLEKVAQTAELPQRAIERVPADEEVSNSCRRIAANDPDALRMQRALGGACDKKADVGEVRDGLERLGLPVGQDPASIDDPVTKASLQQAIGKDALEGLGSPIDIEALLGMLEAKMANQKPRPRPAAPTRGLSSSSNGQSAAPQGGGSMGPSSSAPQGSSPSSAPMGNTRAPGAAEAPPVDTSNWKPGKGDVTPQELMQIVPGLSAEKANEVAPHLNAAMAEAGINTPERKAQFISQLAHESGGFKYDEEIASGAAYEGRSDLGNTQPGDGERFKGRGFIQVTGRANYTAAGKALGLDLVNHPELASRPENASRIAAWYWESRNINQIADSGDVTGVTRAINGGTNGLADRQQYYARAADVLGNGNVA